MRCLLLHREDDPLSPECLSRPWDRVIDLGVSSPHTYEAWGKALACTVEPCPKLDADDFAKLKMVFRCGLGLLVDQYGLDWWDLLSIHWLDQFEQGILLQKVLETFRADDEVFVSCSGTQSHLFKSLVPGTIQFLDLGHGPRFGGRFRKLSRFTLRQSLAILADKYDGSYRLRRLIAPRREADGTPVVLLPSAYENATQMAFYHAASVPDLRFLLVAVRQSGWGGAAPANVSKAHLASYARTGCDKGEIGELLPAWDRLRSRLSDQREIGKLLASTRFDSLPVRLQEGLSVRDSWLNVFAKENISSVLTADERNPYTRIPLLLAQKRGIPTIACHHGAMDGRYRYSDICADRFLAKGQMELDYLVNTGSVSEEKVFVAAPPRNPAASLKSGIQHVIVFFSEPYEALGCRAPDVFAELIPPLISLAAEHGCQLMIKLHPFESLRERKKMVRRVIQPSQRDLLRFVAGPISKDLMQDALFCITVSSTAAVDSAMEGVPSFLCTWLDRSGYGYSDQFIKFGVAEPLGCVEDVQNIPTLLKRPRTAKLSDLWQSAEPKVLRELLLATPSELAATGARVPAERLWA
jgi:hypothetical protein